MNANKTSKSLLASGAGGATPIARDPRALLRAFLSRSTDEELLAEVENRARSDKRFRRDLKASTEKFRARQGVPGRLPEPEVLLSMFEQDKAFLMSTPESAKPDGWDLSKDPHRATLEFFASAFKVEISSVRKSLRRAKSKVGTK